MEKQERRFSVDFKFNWADGIGVEIKKMRDDLDALEKLGATSICIDAEDAYGNPIVTFEAYTYRVETDDEYNARINEANNWKVHERERELKELARLKLKYGL